MRLRQIALVARDLEKVSTDIVGVLQLGGAFADPAVAKYGLANQVWPIGDTFLEVVSPTEPDTTAGRLLEKRGGDGGYMVIFQVEDIHAARARAAERRVRVVGQLDGDGVFMTHLHPKDMGGAIASLDAMVPRERWDWGGPDWDKNVRTESAVAIVGAELQGPDPDAMSARWADVLGRAREPMAGGWRIAVMGDELRFVTDEDGRGEGLSVFDVAVRDVRAVMGRARTRALLDGAGRLVLGGTRVRLVHAQD